MRKIGLDLGVGVTGRMVFSFILFAMKCKML